MINLYHLIGSILIGGCVGGLFGSIPVAANSCYGAQTDWTPFIWGIVLGICASLGIMLISV